MEITLYAGSAVPALAQKVAGLLGMRLGNPSLEHFPDGEVHVNLQESVRGRDVYVIQSTCPPVNENIMELLVLLDACRRAAAKRVTAIVPYFGYARQEKKSQGREPITARLVADILTAAGAERILTVEIHSPAIQGFFNIEMDNLTATPLLVEYLRRFSRDRLIVVAPDAGRVKMAEKFARALDLPLGVLVKSRLRGTEVEMKQVIGEVAGRKAIIVDDMISTGGTIGRAVEALEGAGARPGAIVVAVHPLLVGDAVARLNRAGVADLVVTDSVPLGPEKVAGLQAKVHVQSIAALLADTIRCLSEDLPISPLYGPTA